MNTIDRLTALFSKFPGIGLRQARRFVYFLLTQKEDFLTEAITLVSSLKTSVHTCESCFRFFENATEKTLKQCSLCLEQKETPLLIVVEKDIDIDNMRKGGIENASFFVFGGLLSPLQKSALVRMRELLTRIKKEVRSGILTEIIIALSAHPNGNYTALEIRKELEKVIQDKPIKISDLGRGISTGTEIEYSDPETISHAFANRR